MRAVLVLFDSLNRRYLPPYGNDWVIAPNFRRLAERGVVFDNCYGGSMPCIPARREMHTGRLNFLHRGWGPLEPFDDSMPAMLASNGVYSHLVTDHQHYFEPGGATYHTNFSSWEFIRGQEGDRWKGQVADPEIPASIPPGKAGRWRQDWVNRQYQQTEAEHPQTLVFDAAMEFVDVNAGDDSWFLQVESFDPHEPFHVPERFRDLYEDAYDGPVFEWPRYARAIEDEQTRRHVQLSYAALVSMCDYSLGRLLDAFDEQDLWADTLLMVGTDHGFMLGERGWWAKNIQPWYNDNINTPLMVWDPRAAHDSAGHRSSLVQTIDFAPTLLDYFGVDLTPDMEGVPLAATVATDAPVRAAGLFGSFGGHVNVTDGRYVYMRAGNRPDNQPLFEYTLMPARMDEMMSDELRSATLAEPFPFTKGMPQLRLPGHAQAETHQFGSLLFDLADDPGQERPIRDDVVELKMAELMVDLMRSNHAPDEQFERLGLPVDGAVTEGHLVIGVQQALGERSLAELPVLADLVTVSPSVGSPIGELMACAPARELIERFVPALTSSDLVAAAPDLTLYEIATMLPSEIDGETLARLAQAFADAAVV